MTNIHYLLIGVIFASTAHAVWAAQANDDGDETGFSTIVFAIILDVLALTLGAGILIGS